MGKLSRQERLARRIEKKDRRKKKGLLLLTTGEGALPPVPRPKAKLEPIAAMTEAQGYYMASIEDRQLTFGVGPAGTGKTYVCGSMAAEAMANDLTDKIIITRPAVEAGESLGFLPGELEEKFAPFFEPFREVLVERLGAGHVEYLIRNKRIVAMPLAHMRGHTFKDCWVILDEAQNTTPSQMKLFLTRIGENSKVIVNGDPSQMDITGQSGLGDALRRLDGLPEVGIATFTRADIVRSGLAQKIVDRYEV